MDPVPDEQTCPVCLFPCRSPHAYVLSCCGLKICENCVGPIEASCSPVCRERLTHFLEKDVDRQWVETFAAQETWTAANGLVTELRHIASARLPSTTNGVVFTRKIKGGVWQGDSLAEGGVREGDG